MAKTRKSSRKYNLKRVPKDSYVMIRSKNGYISKPDKRTKYIIEIRSKKSKKVIGYLNKKSKSGEPIPQLFTNTKNFLKKKKRRVLKVQSKYTIILHYKTYIIDQIRAKGMNAVRGIKKFAAKNDFCDVYCDLNLDDGSQLRSEIRRFSKKSTDSDIIEWLAIHAVVNQVRNIGQRMSPKKYARNSREAQRKVISKAKLDIYLTLL